MNTIYTRAVAECSDPRLASKRRTRTWGTRHQAQVAQASAAVEAAKAAIENNVRQRELQDARIQKALAGIDQAKAQIAAAQAGKDAVQAELWRARLERKRQEGLFQTHSTTQQRVEV